MDAGLPEEIAEQFVNCKPDSLAWEDVTEEMADINIEMALKVINGKIKRQLHCITNFKNTSNMVVLSYFKRVTVIY